MAEQGHPGGEQPDIRSVRPTHDEWLAHGWHWSFGWLRRPDMDDYGDFSGFCYESPDGNLMYTRDRDHRLICFLEKWRDRQTGETYFTIHADKTSVLTKRYGLARRQPKR